MAEAALAWLGLASLREGGMDGRDSSCLARGEGMEPPPAKWGGTREECIIPPEKEGLAQCPGAPGRHPPSPPVKEGLVQRPGVPGRHLPSPICKGGANTHDILMISIKI